MVVSKTEFENVPAAVRALPKAARWHFEHGYSIIPMNLNKQPLPKWKSFQEEPTTALDLEYWAFQFAGDVHGWARVTGRRSGLIVLDDDHGGWLEKFGIKPHVRTGSGGFHWLGRHPGWYVKTLNSKSSKKHFETFPNLDQRGDGGYSLIDGFNTRGGYEWLRDPIPDALSLLPPEALAFFGLDHAPVEPPPLEPRERDAARLSLQPGEAVSDDYLVSRALDEAALSGRNNGGFWLAIQLRDNGRNRVEAESAGAAYVSGVVPVNLKGDLEPYTTTNYRISVTQAYSRPARQPWTKSVKHSPPRGGAGALNGNGREPEAPPPPAEESSTKPERRIELTDIGNGLRFARLHRGGARYALSHGWLVYDGTRWAPDPLLAQQLAKEVSASLWRELPGIEGKEERLAHFKWATKSEDAARVQACLAMAKSEDAIRIDGNEIDRQPWLLNVANGTIDLQTGELLSHNPDHLITQISPVEYYPAAECPRFRKAIKEILGGSETIAAYLQQWLGQCLSGSLALQELLMCIGTGNNGKNTLFNAVTASMGSYAGVTPDEWLVLKKYPAHTQELVMLKGKRFLIADEHAEGARFNEALVKKFTGGSPLRGHLMGMNDIEFMPEFKVALLANHKPIIRGTDEGIWRRPPVVPFTVKFHEKNSGLLPVEDPTLDQVLAQEREGILAWLVAGCLKWVENGLVIARPEAVRAASQAYREEMDVVGGFIADRCAVGPLLRERANALFKAWDDHSHGHGGLSLVTFSEQLKQRGFESKRLEDGVYYKGIALREEELPPAPQTDRSGRFGG